MGDVKVSQNGQVSAGSKAGSAHRVESEEARSILSEAVFSEAVDCGRSGEQLS